MAQTEIPYVQTSDGLFRKKKDKGGTYLVQLSNFSARIVADILVNDGVEVRRKYKIEGQINGRTERFSIPGEVFQDMRWVAKHLGAEAVMFPGFTTKEHIQAAIQLLSQPIPLERGYGHTGWVVIDGQPYYLHAGGAIGPDPRFCILDEPKDRADHKTIESIDLQADGPIGPIGPILKGQSGEIRVELDDELTDFRLPRLRGDAGTWNRLQAAVRASMRILKVLPKKLSYPLFAAPWTAALGLTDFGIHLVGETGKQKTSYAALLQQFFGSRLDRENLLASFESTATYVEGVAHIIKDAILVVDELAPDDNNVKRIHETAARLIRAAANKSGRGRARSDGSLRGKKTPRSLMIYTGEDIPKERSVRARVLVLEMEGAQGTNISYPDLTLCQEYGKDALFAEAMSGYIHWLVPQYATLSSNIDSRLRELRDCVSAPNQHPRTTDMICKLAIGFEYFLNFARDLDVLAVQRGFVKADGCVIGRESDDRTRNRRAGTGLCALPQTVPQLLSPETHCCPL